METQKKAVINLMTEDKKLKSKARTIAVAEAKGLKSVSFVGERGDLLEVIAEKIDTATVVDKIRRKSGLTKAWLMTVVINLMTGDQTRKVRAREIATSAANGVTFAGFVGDRGDRLKVIAEEINAATVVDRIRRNAGLQNAQLISVE
ncbi:hypothetical protein NL676_007697 [Syzygium grande]|nr:hypothetical protein NL676_007697 [Syzygium grande]